MQTCVKQQLRPNKDTPIVVNFYAPLDKNDPGAQVEYDYASLGQDEDLIRTDEAGYCLKQCYKMCFYISQMHRFEILRMRAEFIKDLHGTIWFTYASKIWMRPNNTAQE